MKAVDTDKIKKSLGKELDTKRYDHTIGVADTAACMAMSLGADIEKAYVAGLLHDCAKCMSDKKRVEICKKNGLGINPVEAKRPALLHAKVGAYLAKQEYGITDKDILNAICYHTTGRPNMSLLEKIVFTADYIEPGRKQAPNLEEIRRLAFSDLDRAIIKILKDTLDYLAEGNGEIDPATAETYEYYKEN